MRSEIPALISRIYILYSLRDLICELCYLEFFFNFKPVLTITICKNKNIEHHRKVLEIMCIPNGRFTVLEDVIIKLELH